MSSIFLSYNGSDYSVEVNDKDNHWFRCIITSDYTSVDLAIDYISQFSTVFVNGEFTDCIDYRFLRDLDQTQIIFYLIDKYC